MLEPDVDSTFDAGIPKEYTMCQGQHGPTQFLPLDASMVDLPDLVPPQEAIALIVEQTNIYAHQCGGE